MAVFSYAKNTSREIQEDVNSFQLTAASSSNQLVAKIFIPVFSNSQKYRQFKCTFNVYSDKDFTRISKLLILLLNPLTYRLGIQFNHLLGKREMEVQQLEMHFAHPYLRYFQYLMHKNAVSLRTILWYQIKGRVYIEQTL